MWPWELFISWYMKHALDYRSEHSIETAILRVQNDILMALDKGKVVMLVLLDLSAAFDTIDHELLLKRLSRRCGMNGTAPK